MKDTLIKIYVLERRDKNGFKERIEAWKPCKGWRTIYIKQCECVDGHIIEI